MIDIMQQLQLRGIDFEQSGDKYLMMCCPFHEEETPSFSVSLKNGSYRCFSCHERGEFYELIAQLDEIDLLTAKSRVSNMIDPAGLLDLLDKQYDNNQKDIKYYSWDKFNNYFPSVLKYPEAVTYLRNRGITIDSMRVYNLRFGIRKNKFKQRVIIPISQGNRLVSWAGRLIYNSYCRKKTIKYGTPYYTLFGSNQLVIFGKRKLDYLILVEGEFDTIYLSQYGLNVVGEMGSGKINKYRVSLLKKLTKKVVLAYDGDNAGRDSMQINYKYISKYMPVDCISLPEGKDPNTLSTDEVEKLFKEYL